jgi:hypothetical protein
LNLSISRCERRSNFLVAGGPAPAGKGDVNKDGAVDLHDVFYLINYLFAGGPPPVV